MTRYSNEFRNCKRIFSQTGDELFVLIHGFTGSSGREYWGDLENLLVNDHQLESFDFLLPEYATNKKLWPNLFSLLGKDKRIADFTETAKSIASVIDTTLRNKDQTHSLNILGHSLGAHLAVTVAKQFCGRKDLRKLNVYLAAPPNEPPIAAKMHKYISRGVNPQIDFLSSRNQIRDNIVNNVTELRLSKIGQQDQRPTVYCVVGDKDSLAKQDHRACFDKLSVIDAGHSWFRELTNTANPTYQDIRDWATGKLWNSR